MNRILGTSWRTSVGAVGALAALIATIAGKATEAESLGAFLDSVDWTNAVAVAGAALVAFGLWNGRDQKVSSESAGVK